MSEISTTCILFPRTGPSNTARTLELARARTNALGIRKALVATTSGATGVLAAHVLAGLDVIVVTHSAGFHEPDVQELSAANRAAETAGCGSVTLRISAWAGTGRRRRCSP